MSALALPAASVLVIDDRPDLHVVIGRRRTDLKFVPGMIVFPGGRVDPEDSGPDAQRRVPAAVVPQMSGADGAAFLHAAIRETSEEVGLDIAGPGPVDADDFPHVGHWITPEDSPRRFDTHFFMARYLGGEVVADEVELTEAWWERPADILRRVEDGTLSAIRPTLEFLRSLSEYRNVADAFTGTGRLERRGNSTGWTNF